MGQERLEGLRWEGEPQRPVLGFDSASSSSAPKGIVTGFISFCLLCSHNSLLPVKVEGLGWEGQSQKDWAP